jgi:uncharacterized protein YecT (DUF1311 family)
MNNCAANDVAWALSQTVLRFQEVKRLVRQGFKGEGVEIAKKLIVADAAWSDFLPKTCVVESNDMFHGSGAGMIELGCMSRMYKNLKSDLDSVALLATNPDEPVIADMRRALRVAHQEVLDKEYADADARLNATYQKVRESYKNGYEKQDADELINDLKVAELSWISYRDAYCDAFQAVIFPSEKSAAIRQLALSSCYTNKTIERTDELQAILGENN